MRHLGSPVGAGGLVDADATGEAGAVPHPFPEHFESDHRDHRERRNGDRRRFSCARMRRHDRSSVSGMRAPARRINGRRHAGISNLA